jgi:hypothetical protein
MTPEVVEYGMLGTDRAYEISRDSSYATGFSRFWGVTVINEAGSISGLSHCFTSLSEANNYVAELKLEAKL